MCDYPCWIDELSESELLARLDQCDVLLFPADFLVANRDELLCHSELHKHLDGHGG